MNRFFFLFVVCGAGNLLAQTNPVPVSVQFFSTPPAQLRSLNREMGRSDPAVANDNQRGGTQMPSYQDFVVGMTNSNGDTLFETTSASSGGSRFAAMYDRLERQGVFTRPELPTENRLERFAISTFEPEVFHFRKVSVSCSLVTAIKRKNPFCLINPIFFNLSW